MIRILIRVAALAIIAGSIYVVKNVGSNITKPVVKEINLPIVEKNTDELIDSIKKIEAFTKQDKIVETATQKKLILQKNPIVYTPVKTVKKTIAKAIQIKDVVIENIVPAVILPKTAVKVYMYDFEIDLNKKTFPAGEITFTIHNSGLFAHQFAIEGIGNYGLVGRNQTKTFVVNIPKPGTYKVWSEKEMDIEREMHETITVE